MSTPSHDDDGPDLGPVVSRPVPTPRGGFMARPGFKTPPRHAVVVRGGQTPASDEIPLARTSAPPPPPTELPAVSEPAGAVARDKPTLPAIRTPRPPGVRALDSERPTPRLDTVLPPPPALPPRAWLPRGLESFPPPSDAPVATSVRDSKPHPPRRHSSWAIVVAAALGLLFGLVSIVTTRGSRADGAAAARQPVAQELALEPATPPTPSVPSASAGPSRSEPPVPSARPAAAAPSRKKSIF